MKTALLLSLLLTATALAGEGDAMYTVEAKASETAAGAKGTVSLQIKAKDGAHVSAEAPLKIALVGKGVKLQKDKLSREDAIEGKGASPRFEVPFVAEAKGQGTVDADLVFFICTEKLCERQAKKVTIPVNVK